MDGVDEVLRCFEDCVSGDVFILQMIGLYSMGNIFKDSQPKWYFWEVIPVMIGIGLIFFGVSCELCNIHDIYRDDIMTSIEIFAAGVSSVLSALKGFRLYIYRHKIYELLNKCKIRWATQASRGTITERMMGAARNARKFRIFFGFSVSAAVGSYIIRPYILHTQIYFRNSNDTYDLSDTIWPAKYPFTLTSPGWYFLCTIFETICMYFLNFFWIAADTLFIQLMMYLSIQFEPNALLWDSPQEWIGGKKRCIPISLEKWTKIKILSNDILHLHQANPSNDKQLKRIVNDHLELWTDIHSVQVLYNPIIFATVLSNGLNLCNVIYSTQNRFEAEADWGDVGKNIFHGIALISQTYLFCSYAQRLSDEIIAIRQALYNSQWFEFDQKTRGLILIMMIRTQKEYVYSAYNLIYLNMPQVTTIVTATMRFFALLRNVT